MIIIICDIKCNRDLDFLYNLDLDRCVYKYNLIIKVNKFVVNNIYVKIGN